MFPLRTRLSGVSISYALGAILGGAFAPIIAQSLVGSTGWSGSVDLYLGILAIISGSAVLTIKEPRGNPLTPEQENAQESPEVVTTKVSVAADEPVKVGAL